MLYPLQFTPLLVERVWGGRALARFGKSLPANKSIGESWEISDRPEAQSVVANGPVAGQTLGQLSRAHGPALLGARRAGHHRFPLLVKLLDARERLSLQVHPPAAIAPALGGEPKTEVWHILAAAPNAQLLAGLKRGVTKAAFEAALQLNALEPLVHRFPVRAGDSVFIPSGRLHAIDAGLVIVEIQQNSDTTYRVYDWGRPRLLHVAESLASIDFADFEPGKQLAIPEPRGPNTLARLVECDQFHVHKLELRQPWPDQCDGASFHILAGLAGQVEIRCPAAVVPAVTTLAAGEFALLPATLGAYTLIPGNGPASVLKTFLP